MGEMKLTDKGAKLIGGSKLPAGITMDTAGIDLFAMILHIVYAHQYAPPKPKPNDSKETFRQNFKNALDYLYVHLAGNGRTYWRSRAHDGEDRMVMVYTLEHVKRADSLIVAIDPCRKLDECLFTFLPATDTFVQMDLSQIKLLNPL